MTRRLISSGSDFERELSYSRAVIQGDWCFLSGVTGYDHATMTLAPGVEAQAEVSFATVARVLAEGGFAMEDIVRVTHYVAARDHVPRLAPVLRRVLGGIRPAATLVIAGLLREEMLYEVEVTAYRGG